MLEVLKPTTWAILIPMFFLLFGMQSARASHFMGGDISYTCLGNNQYRVFLTIYRDCSGSTMLTNETLSISSASCGLTLPTVSAPLVAGSGNEVSPVCAALLPSTTCNGGTLPGVEEYVYSTIITLPQGCDDWVVSWTQCCRNTSTNLSGSTGASFYINTTINNTNGLCNNSATFSSLPTPYICAGQLFNYNHGAIDVDGDSLIYELIQPLEGPNNPIGYVGSFTPQQPIAATAPGTVFNIYTGQMSFIPNAGVSQTAVVAIRVYEIRNGDTIGITMRDIQVVVLTNCTNTSVAGSSPVVSAGGTFDSTTRSFVVCQCADLDFVIHASDPDGDTLTLDPVLSNIGTVFGPGNVIIFPSYPIPSRRDTLDLFVRIRTCDAPLGVNGFTIVITDNACPIPLPVYLGFNVIIPGINILASDTAICAGIAQTIQLGAQTFSLTGGGTVPGTYLWSQLSGPPSTINNPTTANPTLSVPSTTTPGQQIVLVAQFITTPDPVTGVSCVTSDTVMISMVNLPLNLMVAASDSSLCQNGLPNTVLFNTSVSGPGVNLNSGTYTWTSIPSNRITDLSSTSIGNPIGQIAGNPGEVVKYIVSYTYGVCVGSDTTELTFRSGTVTAGASIDTICSGDTIVLTSSYGPLLGTPITGSCGLAVGSFCVGGLSDTSTVGLPSTTTATYPFTGLWEDGRVQIIYRASELLAAGVPPSLLTEMAFNITNKASTIPYSGFTIKIGCTSLTQFSSATFSAIPLATVYSNTYNSFAGWNNFVFSNPYEWDGTSNLLIEICFDNGAWTGSDPVQCSATTYNSVLSDNADGLSGCTIATPATSLTRPVIRFGYCAPQPPIDYQWSPNLFTANAAVDTTLAWPSGSITYISTAYQEGCPMTDSIHIHVISTTQPPTIACGNPVNYPTEILFGWSGSAGATGWEYSIDSGVTFLNVPLSFDSLLLTGFTNGDCFQLQVRADGPSGPCPENAATIQTCCTTPCINPTQISSTAYTDLSCFESNNGTIAFLATAGDRGPSYTMTLYNAATGLQAQSPQVTPSGSTVFDSLAIGSYFVIGTDTFGCIATSDTITLTQPVVLEASFVGTTLTSCWNTLDGTASVTQTGGTVPYSYLWSDVTVQTTALATGLGIGTYNSIITDANGCKDTVTNISIFGPFAQAPFVSLVVNPSSACPGNGNATILSVQSMAGDPNPGTANSLSYTWGTNGGFVIANDVLTVQNLLAGEYYLTVTDTSGCIFIDTINIGGPQINITSAVPTSPTCNFSNGSIALTVSGDPLGYNYFWTNGMATDTITGLGGGNYAVTVVGLGGCQDTASFTLASGGLTVNVLEPRDERVCPGAATGYIDIDTSTYGGGTVSFLWSNGAITQNVNGLAAGVYNLTVTLNGSLTCEVELVGIEIFESSQLQPNASVIDCGTVQAAPSGGWGTYSYLWSSSLTDTTATISGLAPGSYTVTVTDSEGCTNVETVSFGVPNLDAYIGTVPGVVSFSSDTGFAVPMSAGVGTPELGVNYTWSPAANLTSSNTAQTATLVTLVDGTYSFIVTADNGICQVSDTVSLVLTPIVFNGFPTAFSPNGDLTNPNFRPTPYPTKGIEILGFQVFNRWGQLVFNAANQTEGENGWDGTSNGVVQARDVYIYIFTYRKPGETEPTVLRGNVTLLR